MAKRWHYCGDISLENGGYFWREDGAEDYVNCVRVTPCSDAGGPDNVYWVQIGSVYVGEADDPGRASALESCGYELSDFPVRQRRAVLVEAMVGYRGLESSVVHFRGQMRNTEITVQIGKHADRFRDTHDPAPVPDVILRANASLLRFVRRECLSCL